MLEFAMNDVCVCVCAFLDHWYLKLTTMKFWYTWIPSNLCNIWLNKTLMPDLWSSWFWCQFIIHVYIFAITSYVYGYIANTILLDLSASLFKPGPTNFIWATQPKILKWLTLGFFPCQASKGVLEIRAWTSQLPFSDFNNYFFLTKIILNIVLSQLVVVPSFHSWHS
jgi:hypothetical protein